MKKTRLLLIFCLAVAALRTGTRGHSCGPERARRNRAHHSQFSFRADPNPDGCRLSLRRLRQQTTRAQCQFRGGRFVHPDRHQEQQRRNHVSGGEGLSGRAEVHDRA